MFGITQQPQPPQGPWSGLPTAQAPWMGSTQTWQPAQQAPWRLSPWSTQGMPPAAPVEPIAPMGQGAYLGQGTSGQLPGFQPMMPGGGFGMAPAPAAAQPQQTGDVWYGAGIGTFGDPTSAFQTQQQAAAQARMPEYAGGPIATPTQMSAAQAAEFGVLPGGASNPLHPLYGQGHTIASMLGGRG